MSSHLSEIVPSSALTTPPMADARALARDMNESLKDSPEVAKTLLTDRNARWATWIKQRMAKPGTVFIAVGAGHLAGADSVQAQLAKQGVTAQRIQY